MSTITVQEAKDLTNQTFFNRVWERAKDHRKAVKPNEPDRCLYRSPEGLECFVGCCIPDISYTPQLDYNESVESVIISIMPNVDQKFGREIQAIHDFDKPDSWEKKLRESAFRHNLTIPE